MFKFIAFLFLIFLLLLALMGFTVVRSIKQFLFGGNHGNPNHQQCRSSARPEGNRSSSPETAEESPLHSSSHPRHKVYGKDEGEYVDYEEVK